MSIPNDRHDSYKQQVLAALGNFSSIYGDLKKAKRYGEGQMKACCPLHDDSNPSFSYSTDTGKWTCHTGCGNGDVFEFEMRRTSESFIEVLHRLGDELGVPRSDEKPVTYDYCDENSDLLFQVVRRPGKKFAQRKPTGGGQWEWNLKGVQRALYRWPELIARPEDVVYLVEGEKCAERLSREGRLATTAPGGAGAKWLSEYNDTLRGRSVVALPDNDKPGRAHMEKVARGLDGAAASIRVVEIPGLPDMGDIVDFFDAGRTLVELDALAEAAPLWAPTIDRGKDAQQKPVSVASGGPIAKQVIDLALSENLVLFHDEDREPFAAIPAVEGRRIVALNSREFEYWLGGLTWRVLNKPVSADTLTTVVTALGSIARYEGPTVPLSVRVALHKGEFWVDLDGSRAIHVTPSRWELVPEPPLLFYSFPSQLALPTPQPGGNLRDLLQFVNLERPEDELLLLCYLVAAFVPDIPIPALIVHGPQGAAKTTLLKLLKALIDPFKVAVIGGVPSVEDFVIGARQNRVLYYDNLSSLTKWQSDLLCRAVTGDGHMKRTLYTNADATTFQFRRIVGLSGINNVADKPDLLDRSVLLQLAPVAPDRRRCEKEFWDDFRERAPGIFSGLLDVLTKSLAILPTIHLDNHPRMADFARWGTAVAVALGSDAETFATAYATNVSRQNEAAVDGSPIAQAVLALMKDQEHWNGTAADLLARLNLIAEQERIDTRSKQWPATAAWTARRLREIEVNLLALGLRCDVVRTPERRSIHIQWLESQTGEEHVLEPTTPEPMTVTAPTRFTVMPTVIRNSLKNIGDDSNDGNDGIFQSFREGEQCESVGDWSEGDQMNWEERAAIMEYDGGLSRTDAEACASELMLLEVSRVNAAN